MGSRYYLSKISFKEIERELKESKISSNYGDIEKLPFLEVYHYHEWDHGYETNYGYNGTRREFYSDLSDILNFLYKYINHHKITEFIVTPWYDYDQFVCNAKYYDNCVDIYDEICNFLKKYGVRRSSRVGIKLPVKGNKDVIEMIIEGAFRGISTLRLFFASNNVILDPNHHFGLTFWTQNYLQESIVIKELLKTYPNLRYSDKEDRAAK